MSVKLYFEDFVINTSRKSAGRTITDADIILHAGQTGDFYPHHMDEEWCKTQSFGKRIAHGTLIFSIGIGQSAGIVNNIAITYGYERLRFLKPVYINDTITTTITVAHAKEHKNPGYGIITEFVQTHNQNGELVMVCEHLLLVQKRKLNAA